MLLSACPAPRTGDGGAADDRASLTDADRPAPEPRIALSVPALGVHDYCVTCHRFGYPQADNPAGAPRVHPGDWLATHPPQRFGCTPCHGGDGAALSYRAAGHPGQPAPQRPSKPEAGLAVVAQAPPGLPWSEPAPIAGRVERWGRCGVCHPGIVVPGADDLIQGRNLARECRCAACHITSVNLAGSEPAPALNAVAERLSFDVLAAYPAWPLAFAPDGAMPRFNLSRNDRLLLAFYLTCEVEVLRVNTRPLPPELAALPAALARELGPPDVQLTIPAAAPDAAPAEAPRAPVTPLPPVWSGPATLLLWGADGPADPAYRKYRTAAVAAGRRLFVAVGCAGCHAAGDPAVTARQVGPSLERVGSRPWVEMPSAVPPWPSRFAWLEAHLADPAATGRPGCPQYQYLDAASQAALAATLAAETAPPPAEYVHDLADASPPAPASVGR